MMTETSKSSRRPSYLQTLKTVWRGRDREVEIERRRRRRSTMVGMSAWARVTMQEGGRARRKRLTTARREATAVADSW